MTNLAQLFSKTIEHWSFRSTQLASCQPSWNHFAMGHETQAIRFLNMPWMIGQPDLLAGRETGKVF
jgi:hypothetical protein